MADQQALSQVLRKFARTMASTYDITEALSDLSESVVDVLGATAAGVALLDGDELRFITATSDQAAGAEHLQERLQSGPCVESIERDQPIGIEDVREQRDRWPEYCDGMEPIGFRAVLGLPLRLDDHRVGSLDVYGASPREWGEDVLEAGLVLADIAAAYVLSASELARTQRTTQQLQTALDTRIVIEQAKGILAERLGVTPTEAFERLRGAARRRSVKVVSLAQRVIEEPDYVPD